MASKRPPEGSRAEGVVGVEELDYTEDERVARLSDQRFVISTTDGPPMPHTAPPASRTTTLEAAPSESPQSSSRSKSHSGSESESATPKEQLEAQVAQLNCDHGFSVTAKFDGRVEQFDTFSNQLEVPFKELLTWCASQSANQTPAPEALGLLLIVSQVEIELPRRAVTNLLKSYGVSLDDDVADLVNAIGEQGVSLPIDH